MFGRRTAARRSRSGVFSGPNLRKAALAGVGMLALRWWRNRQASSRVPAPDEPMSSRDGSQPNWP